MPLNADQADAAASSLTPVAKAGIAWAGVGLGFADVPWAQLAAAAAFFYSIHLIIGWWLDRFWRPWLDSRRKRRGLRR